MTLQDKLVEGKMMKKSTCECLAYPNPSQLCVVLICSGMGFAQCFSTLSVQSLTLPSPASVQLAINSFILILKVAHSSLTLLSHGQRGIGLSQRTLLGFRVAIPWSWILSEIHPL